MIERDGQQEYLAMLRRSGEIHGILDRLGYPSLPSIGRYAERHRQIQVYPDVEPRQVQTYRTDHPALRAGDTASRKRWPAILGIILTVLVLWFGLALGYAWINSSVDRCGVIGCPGWCDGVNNCGP